MKKLFLLFCLSLGVQYAHAHGDESRVALESDLVKVQAGKVIYQFQLVDTKSNKLVTDSDLAISHEKKIHLLVYDPSLKEFQHVHPEFKDDMWSVELNFAVNGNYWVWAQGELAVDGEDFSASNRLEAFGGAPAWPMPTSLGDIRTGTSGIFKAEISAGKISAKRMVMLSVTLTRTDGSEPQITPYLGAFAHVVAVPMDGDSLLHVHPMNGSEANEGMIHATFPEAGSYRIWIQYLDGGVLNTIPLSITVN